MSTDTSLSLNTLTKRTVRAWWADGLWGFAVAGFNVLLAGWFYIWVRVRAFPSWTWPWPFITNETVNPMQVQFLLWTIGLIPFTAVYAYGAYRLVTLLKSRWLASRQGDVRHPFWLKVEPRTLVVYLLACLGLFVTITWLALTVTGGAHFASTIIISAYGAVLLALGSAYSLARYIWSGALGILACTLTELFLTSSADFMRGPTGFFNVAPDFGNPAIPLLIFAAIFLVTGLVGLVQVLRKDPYEQQ